MTRSPHGGNDPAPAQMRHSSRPGILLVGIGNEHRGDDAAGLETVRRIKCRVPRQVRVIEHGGEATSLMAQWKDADAVFMVDAMRSGSMPGTVRRMEVGEGPAPVTFLSSCSTHSCGVSQAIDLGRVVRRLPPVMIIYGIEGKDFDLQARVSPEVKTAVVDVAERILQDIEEWRPIGLVETTEGN